MVSPSRKKIALIGARGYVGRELLSLLERHQSDYVISYVTSREHAGLAVNAVFDNLTTDIIFQSPDPAHLAAQDIDIVILGLPDTMSFAYVAELKKAQHSARVIDLSADHRHQQGWVYGLPDLFSDAIKDAQYIANPGCYATAATLALYPLRDFITGMPSIFGLSGYSGAGTTASEKNDPKRLHDNILPYAFDGHGHQSEISRTLGHNVRFMPHVAQFFRGLQTTISVPIKQDIEVAEVVDRLSAAYAGSQTVSVMTDQPEIRQVVGTSKAMIGGFAIDDATNVLAMTSVLDNLLKGAASQCIENMDLSI